MSILPGLILWENISKGKGLEIWYLEYLETVKCRLIDSSRQGIGKMYISFSGCAGGKMGQRVTIREVDYNFC
jgi:hypothetical protein